MRRRKPCETLGSVQGRAAAPGLLSTLGTAELGRVVESQRQGQCSHFTSHSSARERVCVARGSCLAVHGHGKPGLKLEAAAHIRSQKPTGVCACLLIVRACFLCPDVLGPLPVDQGHPLWLDHPTSVKTAKTIPQTRPRATLM